MTTDRKPPPFRAGAGQLPPMLAGRGSILSEFHQATEDLELGAPASLMALIGFRGVGKTVVLREMASMARERGWLPVSIETSKTVRLHEQVADAANEAITEIKPGKAAVKSAAARLRGSATLSFQVEGGTIQLGVAQRSAGDPELAAGIGEALSTVADLVQSSTKFRGCVLLVDELHEADPDGIAELLAAFHSFAGGDDPPPIFLACAGLPHLLRKLGAARTYAERMFSVSELRVLNRPETHDALRLPAKKRGRDFSDNALDFIYMETRGFPYFVQKWGQIAWRSSKKKTISIADVESLATIVQEDLDRSFFRIRADSLTKIEREFLVELARRPLSRRTSAEIAKAMGKTHQQLSPIRRNLIIKGVITAPERGELRFTFPGFDAYLLRADPYPTDGW